MDGLEPMRPVSVQPARQTSAPAWKVGAILVAVVSAAIMAAFLQAGTVVAWVIAVLFLFVGMALFTASVVRGSRENRGHRMPWFRPPPVQPRTRDLLSSAGAPLAGIGTWILARDDALPTWLPFAAVFCAMFGVAGSIHWLHNRRLTTTSDA